jgi:DNA-binding NtrC family response regulator
MVKKSVLLVDVHMGTRESRAANLRKLGATVDCAPNAATGLQQFGAGSYQLVLIDMGHDRHAAEQLASDIRLKNPAQQIGFMVDGPTLISKTLPARPTATPVVLPAFVPAAVDATESAFGRAVKDAEELQQAAIMPDDSDL